MDSKKITRQISEDITLVLTANQFYIYRDNEEEVWDLDDVIFETVISQMFKAAYESMRKEYIRTYA